MVEISDRTSTAISRRSKGGQYVREVGVVFLQRIAVNKRPFTLFAVHHANTGQRIYRLFNGTARDLKLPGEQQFAREFIVIGKREDPLQDNVFYP